MEFSDLVFGGFWLPELLRSSLVSSVTSSLFQAVQSLRYSSEAVSVNFSLSMESPTATKHEKARAKRLLAVVQLYQMGRRPSSECNDYNYQ